MSYMRVGNGNGRRRGARFGYGWCVCRRVLEAVYAPVDFAHVAVLLECGVESERCFESVWCLAAFAEVEVFG